MITATHNPTRRDSLETSQLALLKTNEAAEVLGISRRTLQEKVEAREIAVIRIGRSLRFSPADLAAFVDANRQPARGWKGAKS